MKRLEQVDESSRLLSSMVPRLVGNTSSVLLTAALLVVLPPAPSSSQVPNPISVSVPPILEEAPDSGLYVDPTFSPLKTAEDVVYGQSVNHEGHLQDLLLDVWEPVGHDDPFRPAVVWVHGGGFKQGSKDGPSKDGRTYLSWSPELVRRGYVVVSITYRLRPDLPGGFNDYLAEPDRTADAVPAARDAIEDAKAAVRWVRAHAAEFDVDPDRVSIAGVSAGAITALGVAYDHDDPGDSGNPDWPGHVAAVVAHAGGYFAGALGRSVLPGDPPALLFHGTHDVTVPAAASVVTCGQIVAAANTCEMHLFHRDGLPDAGNWVEDHNLLPWWDDIVAKTTRFLYRHVIAAEGEGP